MGWGLGKRILDVFLAHRTRLAVRKMRKKLKTESSRPSLRFLFLAAVFE